MHSRVALRPSTQADASFALQVRESTMRKYVEQTWGAWDAQEARGQIQEDITLMRSQVIELDGTPIGLMRIDEGPEHLDLDQIFIASEYQRQGIGRFLIKQLIERSRASGKPLRLWVLRVNPAVHFYERMGFEVIDQTHASLRMQRAA